MCFSSIQRRTVHGMIVYAKLPPNNPLNWQKAWFSTFFKKVSTLHWEYPFIAYKRVLLLTQISGQNAAQESRCATTGNAWENSGKFIHSSKTCANWPFNNSRKIDWMSPHLKLSLFTPSYLNDIDFHNCGCNWDGKPWFSTQEPPANNGKITWATRYFQFSIVLTNPVRVKFYSTRHNTPH